MIDPVSKWLRGQQGGGEYVEPPKHTADYSNHMAARNRAELRGTQKLSHASIERKDVALVTDILRSHMELLAYANPLRYRLHKLADDLDWQMVEK